MSNTTISLILIFIFLCYSWKWLIFILLSPVIRILSKRSKTRNIGEQRITDEIVFGNKKNLISTINRYLRGYLRYMDFNIGLIPSHHVRIWIYRNIFCADISSGVVIYWGAEIRRHNRLKIGKGTIIGDRVILDARNGIDIGCNVNFSSNVCIWTEQHDHKDKYFRCTSRNRGGVTIKDRVWIGPNVTILHNLTIGEGAVVAAGSVVTKDVAPYSIVAGIPAREIGKRTQDLLYEFDGSYSPFY